MASQFNCPKCGADISESAEEDDHDTGIIGGWYCDACDEAFAFWEYGGYDEPDDRE